MDEIITFLSENTDNDKIKQQVIELLLANGANVNNVIRGGYLNKTPPLIHAVRNNLIDIYKILIAKGAEVNIPNSEGSTPLMCTNNIEIVKDLIKNGADVNIKNKNGETALSLKYTNKDIEFIKCLIENGADVNIKNSQGLSILLRAYKNNNIDLVTYLIEQTEADLPSEKELATYYVRNERERILSLMKTIKLNIESRYYDFIEYMILRSRHRLELAQEMEKNGKEVEEAEEDENLIYNLDELNLLGIVSDFLIDQ